MQVRAETFVVSMTTGDARRSGAILPHGLVGQPMCIRRASHSGRGASCLSRTDVLCRLDGTEPWR